MPKSGNSSSAVLYHDDFHLAHEAANDSPLPRADWAHQLRSQPMRGPNPRLRPLWNENRSSLAETSSASTSFPRTGLRDTDHETLATGVPPFATGRRAHSLISSA